MSGPPCKIETPYWSWIQETNAFHQVGSLVGNVCCKVSSYAISHQMNFAWSDAVNSVFRENNFLDECNHLLNPTVRIISQRPCQIELTEFASLSINDIVVRSFHLRICRVNESLFIFGLAVFTIPWPTSALS